MIEAILWDNDGVLVETEHLYFEATQHVLSSVGIPLTQEQYVELFLVEGRGAWHLAEEQGVAPSEIDRLRDERNALYGRWLLRGPRLVAGIASVLDALHAKFIMGVVTSSRKDHFDLIHQSTGLLKYFDFVLTAATTRTPSPILTRICGRSREAGSAARLVWQLRIPSEALSLRREPESAASWSQRL
jgi:beta-phosphoglucomutase-like phosphatase (HAD superfamily)